jgi:hypothetical protein
MHCKLLNIGLLLNAKGTWVRVYYPFTLKKYNLTTNLYFFEENDEPVLVRSLM